MILTPENYLTTEYPLFLYTPPGESDESLIISRVFNIELSQGSSSEKGVNSQTNQIYLEPLNDDIVNYAFPKAKKTYKVKVRIAHKTKGKAVNYED